MLNSKNKRINEQIADQMEAGEPIGMDLSTGDISLRNGDFIANGGGGELNNNKHDILCAKPGTKVASSNTTEDFGQTSIRVNEHGEFVNEEESDELNNDRVLVAKPGTKVASS